MDPLIKSQLLYQLSYTPVPVEGRFRPLGEGAEHTRKSRQGKGTGVGDPRAEKAVDFAVLEAYAMSDTTLVREVLAVFCAEAMEWSRRLDADDDGWLEVIHTMKGTSRTIGANRLGDLCEEAEADAARLPAARAELDVVLEAVNDYLGRR